MSIQFAGLRGDAIASLSSRAATRRGFTLIDVLVSLVVVAVLVGLMLPAISGARETARRVVCASNERQIGLGMAMYAEDFDEALVPTATIMDLLRVSSSRDHIPVFGSESVRLRFATAKQSPLDTAWDGLGILFSREYLPAAPLFYCPSHDAGFDFARFEDRWHGVEGRIDGNFQYRGQDGNGNRSFARITPRSTALVSDGLRSVQEFNHKSGANVLRGDLVVRWVEDTQNRIVSILPDAAAMTDSNGTPAVGLDSIAEAWDVIDELNQR
ncbi:MAG: DUF1559 domain-containing protein [Planctomycetota bacterium]